VENGGEEGVGKEQEEGSQKGPHQEGSLSEADKRDEILGRRGRQCHQT
jgi:hypothetical protein